MHPLFAAGDRLQWWHHKSPQIRQPLFNFWDPSVHPSVVGRFINPRKFWAEKNCHFPPGTINQHQELPTTTLQSLQFSLPFLIIQRFPNKRLELPNGPARLRKPLKSARAMQFLRKLLRTRFFGRPLFSDRVSLRKKTQPFKLPFSSQVKGEFKTAKSRG